jgi:hypothetical protein
VRLRGAPAATEVKTDSEEEDERGDRP